MRKLKPRIVFGASVLVVALALDALAQTEARYAELPNFHVVNSQLYRGAQPKAGGLRTLKKIGVKTIVNLRREDQQTRAEGAEARTLGLRYYNVSLPEFSAPKDKEVQQVLAIIDTAENQPVDDIDENGDYRIRVTESSMGDAWRGSFVLKIEIFPSGLSSGSGSGTSTSDLARYVGQYPSALFKGEPSLKTRLRELLGANYTSFTSRLQTEMPIERDGEVMIARGCMAHQCTIEEAILAMDLSNGKPFVAIKSPRYGGGFKIFAEDKNRVPNALRRAMQQD